jgi:hypothetical protein
MCWKPLEKYFYDYLFTSPASTMIGCYLLKIPYAVAETGLTTDQIIEFLKLFEKRGKITIDEETGELLIFNALSYNVWGKGGKPVLDCVVSDYNNVKSKNLQDLILNYPKNINIPAIIFLNSITKATNDTYNVTEGVTCYDTYGDTYGDTGDVKGDNTINTINTINTSKENIYTKEKFQKKVLKLHLPQIDFTCELEKTLSPEQILKFMELFTPYEPYEASEFLKDIELFGPEVFRSSVSAWIRASEKANKPISYFKKILETKGQENRNNPIQNVQNQLNPEGGSAPETEFDKLRNTHIDILQKDYGHYKFVIDRRDDIKYTIDSIVNSGAWCKSITKSGMKKITWENVKEWLVD